MRRSQHGERTHDGVLDAGGTAQAIADNAHKQQTTSDKGSHSEDASAARHQGDGAARTTSSDGARNDQAPAGGGAAGADSATRAADAQAAQVPINAESPGAIIDSLAQVPASRAIPALAQAEAASPAGLARQRDAAQQSLPEISTPTGLPAKKKTRAGEKPSESSASMQTAKEIVKPEQTGGTDDAANVGLVEEAPPDPQPSPADLAGGEGGKDENGNPTTDPALARSAQNALVRVSAPAAQVSTRARDVPNVDMSGEADPGQLQSALDASSQQTRQVAAEAGRDSRQDFGENDIFPEPHESSAEVADFGL
ncbi:MAG: hypothetical protein MJE77_17940 [Proteobacteria bacterium]|nr:hypothetical protein [Pseudomonadota bacterium]